jgi:hypothetical protein
MESHKKYKCYGGGTRCRFNGAWILRPMSPLFYLPNAGTTAQTTIFDLKRCFKRLLPANAVVCGVWNQTPQRHLLKICESDNYFWKIKKKI